MDTYIEKITLARAIAAERTTVMRREPVILDQRGMLLQAVQSGLRGIRKVLTEALVIPQQKVTYCTFNPSKC
jgi:hypothetical protein